MISGGAFAASTNNDNIRVATDEIRAMPNG
jgi:hypothetical protein